MDDRSPELLVKELKEVWIKTAEEWNKISDFKVFLTQTYRSKEKQKELYSLGRTKPGKIVTWTLNSKHNEMPSKAFDIAFKDKDGKLNWDKELFRQFAVLAGKTNKDLKWGGNWKTPDYPHFEI